MASSRLPQSNDARCGICFSMYSLFTPTSLASDTFLS